MNKVNLEKNAEGKWKWIELDKQGNVLNESAFEYDNKGSAKAEYMRQLNN